MVVNGGDDSSGSGEEGKLPLNAPFPHLQAHLTLSDGSGRNKMKYILVIGWSITHHQKEDLN